MGLGVIHHLQPWVKVALRFVEGWHCSLQTNMFFSSIFSPPIFLLTYLEVTGKPQVILLVREKLLILFFR